jgi:quinol monooxygenase YgiN
MKPVHRFIAVAAFMAPTIVLGAPAPQPSPESVPGPRYMMTHIEVAPNEAAKALTAMKAYREAALKEPGATGIDLFQETGHPSRFIISEVWRDHQALVGRADSAAGTALVAALKPIEFKPADIRVHFLYAGTPYKAPRAGNVMVISHVDLCCGGTPVLEAAMKSLAEAAMKERGMVRYEMLDQLPPRQNHARAYEEWASEQDWVAHNLSQPVRDAFAKMQEYLGTPYDQRLYRLVN